MKYPSYQICVIRRNPRIRGSIQHSYFHISEALSLLSNAEFEWLILDNCVTRASLPSTVAVTGTFQTSTCSFAATATMTKGKRYCCAYYFSEISKLYACSNSILCNLVQYSTNAKTLLAVEFTSTVIQRENFNLQTEVFQTLPDINEMQHACYLAALFKWLPHKLEKTFRRHEQFQAKLQISVLWLSCSIRQSKTLACLKIQHAAHKTGGDTADKRRQSHAKILKQYFKSWSDLVAGKYNTIVKLNKICIFCASSFFLRWK